MILMSEIIARNISDRCEKSQRAFELDLLRGVSVVMMILHHAIFDIRYVFEIDAFAWQESFFFQNLLRPPFVFLFLFVSGVCCSFSRSNYRRALKFAFVAVLFSLVFFIVSKITDSEMYIVSNVILILALGTFAYSVIESLERKKIIKDPEIWIISLAVVVLVLNVLFNRTGSMDMPWLSPLHKSFETGFGMADYMPVIPWISMFFSGALVGRLFYSSRRSLFPEPPSFLMKIFAPLIFTGRNALVFYLFHQPVILMVLFLLRETGII